MNKLVVIIMGQNCEKFLPMCLESVKDADAIVYCDGGSRDGTITYLFDNEFYDGREKGENIPFNLIDRRIINNTYNQDDPQMNGKQRNFYLDYVKKEFSSWWCLVLDADEVVENIVEIKNWINRVPEGVYSVKMRHFHNDLGHEDNNTPEHWVPNRLFKISCADKYTEVEHSILQAIPDVQVAATACTTIWHLAHINHCFSIKARYEKNLKHSNMHTPEFLNTWYRAHLFGRYPNKEVNPIEIPKPILDYFRIDKDEFYFANRGIDIKHPLMVKEWADHFKPESVLDLGCGRGPYLYFWKWYTKDYAGIELSQWAVNHAFCDHIIKGDISTFNEGFGYDLVTAIDVLEHLDDEQLNKTLDNMAKYGKRFLFSIPFIGDPNLANDNTHKQFRTKEEWKKLILEHGIETEEAPKEWLFNSQLLIGKLR